MIGLIGGSGLYDPGIFHVRERKKVHTPYGSPSDMITVGSYEGINLAFLPRHGPGHVLSPTHVNYRANIHALKSVGVDRILSVSAVGSLQENIHPGELVLPDQFIDRTTLRKSSFFDGSQVAHVSMATPFCPHVRGELSQSLSRLKMSHHANGTYVCIEGPRFSTRAESKMFQSWGGHVIGMTLVPEVVLAREAELCYSTIALVTDYDSFKDHPVTADEVVRVMRSNVEKARSVLLDVIPRLGDERTCACGTAMKNAFM
jgi:5'-methylthioadenosine phosphorylase